MRPFLEWTRHGPRVEKGLVSAVALIVLSLVAWAAAPTGSGPADALIVGDHRADDVAQVPTSLTHTEDIEGPEDVESDDPVPRDASIDPTTEPTSPGAAVGAEPGTRDDPVGADDQRAADCGEAGATDQGVTDTEIHVAVTVFNVFGANSTIGIPGADDQRKIYDALFGSINAGGGIHCRQVVPRFYEMNPLDQSSQQAGCLRIIEDRVFALVGAGGFFPQSQSNCIPRNGIPIFMFYGLLPSEEERLFPYVFSVRGRVDRNMRTWVLGARDQGFFDDNRGFEKLGIFAHNCSLEANHALDAALASIGIAGNEVSKFVAECPISGQTPPNQCTQAALQHSSARVSHVLLAAGGSPNNCYVNAAARQGYLPTYSTSDYTLGISPPTVGESPNAQAFNGTLGITATRFGHFNSGLAPEAGTRWCNEAFAAHGLPQIAAEDASNLVHGTACTSVQLFRAAAGPAPSLRRTALVDGLAGAGLVEFGWPGADAVFDRPGKVSGGDFYRPVRWTQDCSCWRVVDASFLRSPA